MEHIGPEIIVQAVVVGGLLHQQAIVIKRQGGKAVKFFRQLSGLGIVAPDIGNHIGHGGIGKTKHQLLLAVLVHIRDGKQVGIHGTVVHDVQSHAIRQHGAIQDAGQDVCIGMTDLCQSTLLLIRFLLCGIRICGRIVLPGIRIRGRIVCPRFRLRGIRGEALIIV